MGNFCSPKADDIDIERNIEGKQNLITSEHVLSCYSRLMKMGFDDYDSLEASKQFDGDLNKAANYLTLNKTNKEMKTKEDDMIDDIKEELITNECLKSFNQCLSVQRVLLILKQQNKINESQSAIDFLTKLLHNNGKDNYNGIIMMRDFNHFKEYHINDIMDNNKCEENECFIKNRHMNRDRKMYKNKTIKEVNILQYIDMIHCILFHEKEELIAVNSKNNKFVTNIDININENEDKEKDKDELKEEKDLYHPHYQFGHKFSYWNKNEINFVDHKYNNLKEEYLNNSLHKIDLFQFELLSQKAMNFQQIYKDNMMKAKREQSYMVDSGFMIKRNDEMSLQHIMVIMSYCDLDEMQRMYKKYGFQEMKRDESMKDVEKRNSEIAIWCRLFQEVVDCFGDILQQNKCIYHGLSTKLLFSKMGTTFEIPTSCTRSLEVAQIFATNNLKNGIIVKLERNQSEDELNYYFDVYSKYLFSSYPNEKENILFGAWLGFKNIIYHDIFNKVDHSQYIESLKLYQQIIYGEWFTHNTDIFNVKNEENIIKFMKCMMLIEKFEIDFYLLYLFINMTMNVREQIKIIYLNKEEFGKLSIRFQETFMLQFVKFLDEKGIKIRYNYNIMTMDVTKQQILSSNPSFDAIIKSAFYEYELNDDEHIKFYFFVCRNEKFNSFHGFFCVESLPSNIDWIEINYGLFFPQILFQKWAFSHLSSDRLYSGGNIFKLSIISSIDSLQINVAFQIIRIKYKQHRAAAVTQQPIYINGKILEAAIDELAKQNTQIMEATQQYKENPQVLQELLQQPVIKECLQALCLTMYQEQKHQSTNRNELNEQEEQEKSF